MIRFLKKYFIPHQDNDHKPHLLRWETVLFICSLVLLAEGIFLVGLQWVAPYSQLFGSIIASTLVTATDTTRVANGVAALAVNQTLEAAAQAKADDMVKNGYFAHTSPSGVTPWHWFDQAGYRFVYAGENLAVNFTDSKDVVDAWMNSPKHRANILDSHFTEIGIATAQGMYDGHPAVYVVQMFGTPVKTSVAKTSSAQEHVSLFTSSSSVQQKETVSSSPKEVAIVKGTTTQETAEETSTAPLKKSASMENGLFAFGITHSRQVANSVYYAIIAIFCAALALEVFIKLRTKHPKLVLGGLLVIIVVAICIALNQYFLLFPGMIL